MARDPPFVRDGAVRTRRLGIGRPRHNLPAQLSSFIGRAAELAELERLHRATRLLTLTGTGGVGKTRLALELAERLLPAYPHGVWQVELAALAEPRLVPEAVAAALGVHEQAGRPLGDTLAAWLAGRELLLVLDNCEHLLAACGGLAERLLRGCPGLRVLATSRQPLGVAGETDWRVPPLALPTDADGPTLRRVESEAVRLFVARARAARAEFALTADAASAVAEICRRLDGIPLAIELAAARVAVLTVEQLAARLDDRFRLLARPDATALPRHRTLRALVDWSYDLLSEPEQRLLRRLAVFAGGWTLEAAEQVCAGDGVAAEDILDLLERLVAKSLVLAEEQPSAMRYRLLETIRAYARAKLEVSGEAVAIRHRHQRWFTALAEREAMRVLGPDIVAALDRLAAELDNIRTALSWSREAPPADSLSALEQALRLAAAAGHFWDIRGLLNEGRAWLDELLTRASALARPAAGEALVLARGRALYQAGYLALTRGEAPKAERLMLEGAAECRAAGDEFYYTWALSDAGFAVVMQGDLERAAKLLDEGLALGSRIGSPFVVAACKFYFGELAALRGDSQAAGEWFEASLADTRRDGVLWGTPYVLSALGQLATAGGEHARAVRLQREGLAVRVELRDVRGIAYSLADLGMALAARGDAGRAAEVLGSAEALLELLGVSTVFLPDWPVRRERAVAAARAALGDGGFVAAYARGRALPLEQAVRHALGEAEPKGAPAEAASDPELARLTPREREVAALVARGLTNRQIAEALGIAERTAETHARNIREKLGLTTRAHVAAWAAHRGLSSPD